MPCDGRSVYVQLTVMFGVAPQSSNQYVYTAASGCAAITTPRNGATLGGRSASFTWNAVPGATQYKLQVGSGTGEQNIFGSVTTATSVTVHNIPCAVRTIYVSLTTYLNQAPQNAGLYQYTASSQCAPDFDGDGKDDVFLYDPVSGNSYAGLSTGAGSFNYNFSPATPGFDVLRQGSFNHDAYSDLLAYNGTSALGYTLLGTGSGTFTPVSLFWGPGFKSVAAGDLNGDGITDLLIYRPTDGTIYSVISNGDGTFFYQYSMVSTGFTNMQVADFNGDGQADVFFYRATDGLAYLGINIGSYGFRFSPVTLGPGYDFIERGDINGDGKPDLLFYNSTTGAAQYGLSTGSGFTFSPVVASPGFTAARMFDYNGDGFAEYRLVQRKQHVGISVNRGRKRRVHWKFLILGSRDATGGSGRREW